MSFTQLERRLTPITFAAVAFLAACGPRTVEELDDAIGFSVTRCTGPDCALIGFVPESRIVRCTDTVAVDGNGWVWTRNGCAGQETLQWAGRSTSRDGLDAAFDRATSGAPNTISEGSCYGRGSTRRSFERYRDSGSEGLLWNYCEGSEGEDVRELERLFEAVR